MELHLVQQWRNLIGTGDPVDQLPIESTLAAGKFAIQMRVLRRGCGHSELLADVCLMDDGCRPLMLLNQQDLQEFCLLLAEAAESAERHIARQRS